MMKFTPKHLLISLILLTVGSVGGLAFYISDVISEGLPSLEQLENPKQKLATRVFCRGGELLDHFAYEKRVMLPYDSMPSNFINALVATEDKHFYDHWGLHTIRIFKAAFKDVFLGKREGASTITQQLARNMFLNHERTLKRKIREAAVAIMIEQTYTKAEILAMYTNTVNFGRGAYGIHTASNLYFDKNPGELELEECAFLTGILKAPEAYNGRRNMAKAVRRRNTVLALMRNQGFISPQLFDINKHKPITALAHRRAKKGLKSSSGSYFAPHFVEMIRQKVGRLKELKKYNIYSDGLKIHTTINHTVQKYANQAVEEHLKGFQKQFLKKWSWGKNKTLLNTLITNKRQVRIQKGRH